MASVRSYRTPAGATRFVARVRLKGLAPISQSFDTRKEAADWGQEQGEPETAGPGEDLVAEVGGQHEKSGMGDIQDPHHAKDDIEARRDKKKHHAESDAVNRLSHVHRSRYVHEKVLSDKNSRTAHNYPPFLFMRRAAAKLIIYSPHSFLPAQRSSFVSIQGKTFSAGILQVGPVEAASLYQ